MPELTIFLIITAGAHKKPGAFVKLCRMLLLRSVEHLNGYAVAEFSVDLMTCREAEFESLKSTVSVIPKEGGMALLRQEIREAFMHLSFVVWKCHEKPECAIETGNDRAK